MTAIVCQFLWSGIVSDEDKNRPEGPQYTLKVSWCYRTVSPQSVTTIKMKRCCSGHCVVWEKNHTHPMEGHWKFLGEGGVSKVKNLEAKYEAKLEFPGGGQEGVQNKKPSVGEVWIFSRSGTEHFAKTAIYLRIF